MITNDINLVDGNSIGLSTTEKFGLVCFACLLIIAGIGVVTGLTPVYIKNSSLKNSNLKNTGLQVKLSAATGITSLRLISNNAGSFSIGSGKRVSKSCYSENIDLSKILKKTQEHAKNLSEIGEDIKLKMNPRCETNKIVVGIDLEVNSNSVYLTETDIIIILKDLQNFIGSFPHPEELSDFKPNLSEKVTISGKTRRHVSNDQYVVYNYINCQFLPDDVILVNESCLEVDDSAILNQSGVSNIFQNNSYIEDTTELPDDTTEFHETTES